MATIKTLAQAVAYAYELEGDKVGLETANTGLEKELREVKKELTKYRVEVDKQNEWAKAATAEHVALQSKHEKFKAESNQLNSVETNNRRIAERDRDEVKKQLDAVTRERDNLQGERDALAKAGATLQEQLNAAKAAQQTQTQPSAVVSEPEPQLTPQQQAIKDKSDSIFSSLRASRSQSQASPQQPLQQLSDERKYTRAECDNMLAEAEKEWFTRAKAEAEQYVHNLIAGHNQFVQDIIRQGTQELNHWKSLVQNNADSNHASQVQALQEQHKNDIEVVRKEKWNADVESGKLLAEKQHLVGNLKNQQKLSEEYRAKWNDVKWELQKANNRAEENYNACVNECQLRISRSRTEEKIICDLKDEIKALKEQSKNRDKAENVPLPEAELTSPPAAAHDMDHSRFLPQLRQPVPQTATAHGMDHSRFLPRMRGNAAPTVQYIEPPKASRPQACRPRTKSKAAPAAESTPAPQAKNNKRKRNAEEEIPWDDPPASKLLKTAAIASFIGLVQVAKGRGYF
ncbi:hypothetical protein N431DRAFT_445170 [Stipitochalara longipes BDJ]|nr:hypothetical protein N431DRAFT_445170 [Stipitochalara longipes BDJ]